MSRSLINFMATYSDGTYVVSQSLTDFFKEIIFHINLDFLHGLFSAPLMTMD